MKEFLNKNKKSIIIASILLFFIHLLALFPFLFIGIKKDVWDIYIYLDNLAIIVIVLLCITLIYREWIINHIRKKTKNWAEPLKDEEKKSYQTFTKSVFYQTLVSAMIYFMVASIYYSL